MVHLTENEGIENQVFVVTGGAGFVGAALCLELLRRGASQVRSIDCSTSSPWLPQLRDRGVVCVIGDIRLIKDVEKVVKGADCVFHMASFGMSGKEMLQSRRIDEVNLEGTCHILESCIKFGVERLVYTSTYNVVFGGQEIRDGNEAMAYFPLDQHIDPYGRSKALAEQLVRKANNASLRSGKGVLRTCAIRPAAIYGPGERRHIPRILNHARWGLFKFRIGGPEVRTDWVYVDNLIHAQLLASMGLLNVPGGGNAPASGQVYFISDGEPVNTFKFLRPLVEALGYNYPIREISVKWAMSLAWCIWGVYGFLHPILNKSWLPQPFIFPAEVHKVGITHFCSMSKARHELQYEPIVSQREGMKRTIQYWKGRLPSPIDSPHTVVWVLIVGGMTLHFLSAFFPPQALGPIKYVQSVALLLFRSRTVLRLAWFVAVLLHVVEALYASLLARKIDAENELAWALQTFVLGYPSLNLLIRRRN